MGTRKIIAIAAIAAFAFVNTADAAVLQFLGEDLGNGEAGPPLAATPNSDIAETAFLNNLIGVGTEDFESFADGTGAALPLNFGAAGMATLTGTGAINNVTPGMTNGFGRYATSGAQYWEVTGSFGVDFSAPVAAFGFHGVDIGDFDGNITIDFELQSGATDSIVVANSTNINGGSVLYFGYINTDDLIVAATFGNTNAGTDFFAFDDFTIGSVEQVVPNPGGGQVPEPATMALFGMGLAGVAARRKFKKN